MNYLKQLLFENINYIKNFILTMILFTIPQILLLIFFPFHASYWHIGNGLLTLDMLYGLIAAAQSFFCWNFSDFCYIDEDFSKVKRIITIVTQLLILFLVCLRFFDQKICIYIGIGLIGLAFIILGLIKLYNWDMKRSLENISKQHTHKVYVLETETNE